MDAKERLKLELDMQKFNYEIDKTNLLHNSNNFTVILIGFLGMYVSALQILVSEGANAYDKAILFAMFIGLVVLISLIFQKTRKRIERDMDRTTSTIWKLHRKLLE